MMKFLKEIYDFICFIVVLLFLSLIILLLIMLMRAGFSSSFSLQDITIKGVMYGTIFVSVVLFNIMILIERHKQQKKCNHWFKDIKPITKITYSEWRTHIGVVKKCKRCGKKITHYYNFDDY